MVHEQVVAVDRAGIDLPVDMPVRRNSPVDHLLRWVPFLTFHLVTTGHWVPFERVHLVTAHHQVEVVHQLGAVGVQGDVWPVVTKLVTRLVTRVTSLVTRVDEGRPRGCDPNCAARREVLSGEHVLGLGLWKVQRDSIKLFSGNKTKEIIQG